MKYSVYFMNESNEWELLLSGLTQEGAGGHAAMYARLFHTETKIVAEDK